MVGNIHLHLTENTVLIVEFCKCVILVYNGARGVHICDIYAVKHVQKCVRKDYLSCALFANVAGFVLFAGVLCERRRTCVIRSTFLEFPGITPSVWSWVQIQ